MFTRFDDYYWKGLPYLDEVEFRWGIDQSVQLLMMQRGELDLMGYGLNAQSLAETSASDRLKKYRFEQRLLSSRWINMHPRVEAFRDVRVRQALNWATDRDQLQRVTGGEATAWGAPFPKRHARRRAHVPAVHPRPRPRPQPARRGRVAEGRGDALGERQPRAPGRARCSSSSGRRSASTSR